MDVYGLPNCDATKFLIKRLNVEKTLFRFVNLKENVPSQKMIVSWISNLGAEKVLNKQSTTWRNLPEAQRNLANTPEFLSKILQEHPLLIKRPLIYKDGKYFTGIKEPGLTEFLNH